MLEIHLSYAAPKGCSFLNNKTQVTCTMYTYLLYSTGGMEMESEWGAQNQYTWTNPKHDEKGKDDYNTHLHTSFDVL